ncbi:rasGAP-activating-like protein 1 isoform X1 [Agelaius tricolor]|uniref:rasGAP-activating-like protein 1 isoform X1 n=1 Tax=Agelaius tricolor TaxID=9191 RepID=UPI0039F24694
MAKTAWLRCRVLEGKDLPAKDLSGSSNPYCVVKVDNEVVARTATVWKSLNPFWGEEITLLLPRGFHSLAIYVLDEDTIGQDDVIGKVSLSHQQISAEPRGIDSWLSLAPVSPDQEVQGEIHLELQVPERGHPRVLRCHLIEARDLAPRDASGTSDPFGRVSCCGHTLETAVVKKTRFPRWDEALEFELPEGELGEAVLSVELWDWDIVGKNDFLGRGGAAQGTGTCPLTHPDPASVPQVEFFLDTLCPGPTRGWFHLLPFPSTTEDHGGQLGALRLAVRLLEDTVLPSHHYQPLIQLLTEPILCPAQNPKGTALAVLEEVTSGESRQDVATKLVKLFLGQGLAVPLLDYLTSRELARTTDPNTLFRSNSLASKSMEQFMKAVGLHYLHEVLKPVVNRIFEEKKYVELDPGKMELSRGRRISLKGSLSEVQVRESSLELLKGYLGDILDAIVGSVDKCPLPMRVAFQQLRRRVEQRFPLAQHEVGPAAGLGVCTDPGAPRQAQSCACPLSCPWPPSCPCPPPGGAVLLHQWVPLPSLLRSCCAHPEALRAAGAARGARHRPHAPAARQGSAEHREPGAAAGAGQGAVDGPAERRPPAQCHPCPGLPGCPGHRGGRGASATGTLPALGHHQGGSPAHLPRAGGGTAAPLRLQEEALQAQHPGPGLCQGAPGAGARLHPSGADPGSGAGGQGHLPAPPRAAGGGTGCHRAAPHHLPPVQVPSGVSRSLLSPQSALELWQWLWALRQATSANRDMLPTFHPGTFRASRWTCCLQPTRAVPECSRAHGAVVLGDWSDLGDPAVAAQSLYGHLRAALAGGPEGSAVAGPPCPGQAGGPDPTLGCSGTRWGQAAGGAARPGHRPRRLRPPRRDPRATPKSPPCPQRPPLGPARAGHRGDAGPAARHGVYSVTQRCTWHRLCAAPGAAAGDTGDTGGTGGTGDTGGTDAQRGHG